MGRIIGRTYRGGGIPAVLVVALYASFSANGQLVTNTQGIPDTGKPPVVFLNGYQFGCMERPTFAGTFGLADQILQRDARVTLFFNNCDVPGNPPIEDLGNAFRDYLNGLRYTDGREVPQVDVVAHSMGGMIVRSYLTGKQRERGVFRPPVEVKIRKAVFLATPFFGSIAANAIAPDNDAQAKQLQSGSPFTFDLATWNQGRDDLRGIDAVAVLATGGSGILSTRRRFDDSTVTLTSGSLEWYSRGRTRIVPELCHTVLTGLLAAGCINPGTSIARITDDQHPSARVILSFLNNTADWMSVGSAPTENEYLKERAGVQVRLRDSQDVILGVRTAGPNLSVRGEEVVWTDFALASTLFEASLTLLNGTASVRIAQTNPGYTQAFDLAVGAGPTIAAVITPFGDVAPRAAAPGGFITIYGGTLSISTGTAESTAYPITLGGTEVLLDGKAIGLQYASPTQINAVVPDNASGVMRLGIRNANGFRGTNLLIEPSVPSLFQTAVNAVTNALISPSAPAHPGDYLTLYATGLGLTDRRADGLDWARIQPVVTAGGQLCAVSFAGRAPGFVGLDQINCRIAVNAALSASEAVSVQTGRRVTTVRVPIL